MLEGESLLNDASGLTLFEVFFHLVSIVTATTVQYFMVMRVCRISMGNYG
jgi:NhaP-type Na+/H+ or K+/H+ antiporter